MHREANKLKPELKQHLLDMLGSDEQKEVPNGRFLKMAKSLFGTHITVLKDVVKSKINDPNLAKRAEHRFQWIHLQKHNPGSNTGGLKMSRCTVTAGRPSAAATRTRLG